MLEKWIQFSFRRFLRNKTNSIINLLGLSLGIFVFTLIFIFVRHEFSYDKFHEDGDRIFRLIKSWEKSENSYMGINSDVVFSAPFYEVLKSEISGVEYVTRLNKWGTLTVEADEKYFHEESYYAADNDLFKILTFRALAGNLEESLQHPQTVAINASTARKYFGRTDVIGEVLNLEGFMNYGAFTVDFVFEDFPSTTAYPFNIILRLVDFVKIVQPSDLNSWDNNNYNFLVKTKSGTPPVSLENGIKNFFLKKYEGTDAFQNKLGQKFTLEPISEVYLGEEVNFSITARSDANRLLILATIACFVLVVAGVNYVNLTTAQALARAKEVGVRKVSGALRKQLIAQFLGDSLLVSLTASALAAIACWLAFPLFRDFVQKPITISFTDPILLSVLVAGPLGLGLVAGIYPAYVLSSFNPVKVLKGSFSRSSIGLVFRNILTVLQFSISGALFIAVIILQVQFNFIETNNPGYDREHIVAVNIADEGVRQKVDYFIQQLEASSNIESVSRTSYLPNHIRTQQSREWYGEKGKALVSFYTVHADHHYLNLFNIPLLQGRNFIPDGRDRNSILINETAARTYGWDNPVGMQFTGERNLGQPGDTVTIIGVVKDIHFVSYRSPIKPMRVVYDVNDWCRWLAIKIKPGSIPETTSFIESEYKKLATTKLPYKLTFFDEAFDRQYSSDRKLGQLINLFSIVSLVIACLGLYGLSLHAASARLKEISIRRVMGARLDQVVYLLSNQFVWLVIIALVIASPITYIIMNNWLQGFAYHVSITVWPFVAAFVGAIALCLAVVGIQAWKTVTVNPAEILRND